MSNNISRIGRNTPGQANVQVLLREAQEKAAEFGATKAIVMLLSDEGEFYDRVYMQAGMGVSEAVALIEITKHGILQDFYDCEEPMS